MQNLTLEQLTGEGNFIKPHDQIWMPKAAFLDVANAVKTALLLTQMIQSLCKVLELLNKG